MPPVDKIRRDCMTPDDVAPHGALRIVLVKEVVVSLIVHRTCTRKQLQSTQTPHKRISNSLFLNPPLPHSMSISVSLTVTGLLRRIPFGSAPARKQHKSSLVSQMFVEMKKSGKS